MKRPSCSLLLVTTALTVLPAAIARSGSGGAFAPTPLTRMTTMTTVTTSPRLSRKRRSVPCSSSSSTTTTTGTRWSLKLSAASGGRGGGDKKGFSCSPDEDLTPRSSISEPTTPPPPPPSASSSSPLGGGQFELQEMKFQIRSLLKRSIPSRALYPEKRDELASYVRAVALRIPSPVPPSALAEPGRLGGTQWKLAFSTESATLGDLPREATVRVRFKDDRRVDYELEFTEKVWGLKKITAESDYSVDPGPLNPGLVTMVYDKITARAFGATLPVGMFGMLKGRANYIETVWNDGDFWIDRGFGSDGTEYFNVFVRDDSDDGKGGEADLSLL